MPNYGYENPLDGLEQIGRNYVHDFMRSDTFTPELTNRYAIVNTSEEELVEVISALAGWIRSTQETFDVYHDFAPETLSEDELENYKALQYQAAVVSKFVESLKPSLTELGLG